MNGYCIIFDKYLQRLISKDEILARNLVVFINNIHNVNRSIKDYNFWSDYMSEDIFEIYPPEIVICLLRTLYPIRSRISDYQKCVINGHRVLLNKNLNANKLLMGLI